MFQEVFCSFSGLIFSQIGLVKKGSSTDFLLHPIVFPGILNDNVCFPAQISIIFVHIKKNRETGTKLKGNNTATLQNKKPYETQADYFYLQ
jgi:hypothetical protein